MTPDTSQGHGQIRATDPEREMLRSHDGHQVSSRPPSPLHPAITGEA